ASQSVSTIQFFAVLGKVSSPGETCGDLGTPSVHTCQRSGLTSLPDRQMSTARQVPACEEGAAGPQRRSRSHPECDWALILAEFAGYTWRCFPLRGTVGQGPQAAFSRAGDPF